MAAGQNHINYVVRGTGDPTLIFVHGFACALDDWEEQLRGLSPSFRCVALDLPGHGYSAEPDTASIEILAAAVNRVKDQVAASNSILVGHSMGCRVIVEAYQQSSVTVSGLVFVDGSFLGADLVSAMKTARPLSIALEWMRSHTSSSATCSWKAAILNSEGALSPVLKASMLVSVKTYS